MASDRKSTPPPKNPTATRNILMINRIAPPMRGPTGRLLYDLACELSEQGHNVSVLCTGITPKNGRDENGIEMIRITQTTHPRTICGTLLCNLRLFLKALFLPRPDVIISKTDPPFLVIFCALLSLLKWTKHIHWCQDIYPDILPALDYKLPKPLYSVLDLVNNAALRSCMHIVTIGSCMKHALMRKNIPSAKISIIPNWYNTAFIKQRRNNTLLSSHTKFRVLFAGNMGRAHPYQTLFDAAHILNDTTQDIEFLFVGSGEKLDDLANLRQLEGLENIRFLPYQPDENMEPLLESGDVHVITMRDEALGCMLPSRVYDIMHAQRPCLFIGPEACDLSVMLETYQAGLSFAPDRPDLLANAIKHLRDNSDHWFALHQGAERAAQVCTPQESFRLWKKVIHRLT